MDRFLDQLPALVGVIIGVFATITATSLTDRIRWLRDQSVRWDERRLDAYAEYARTLKEIQVLAFRLTAAHRPASQMEPIDREVGLELLAQADAERTRRWEAVLLLGDDKTVTAAREWRETIWELEKLARGPVEKLPEWTAAVRLVDKARNRFYEEARKSLLIRRGSVKQESWQPYKAGE